MSIRPRELLLQRASAKSIRGEREDKCHLALILEGGGMRGVVSIAMASSFEERGFLSAFDSIHGSSAGACGAAYFAASQSQLGASIYYEDINNNHFINPFRALIGLPVMNKEFLVDFVMRSVKPLQTERLLRRPGYINIVTTDAATGEDITFREFTDGDVLLRVLKASICLPIIAGHSVNIDGRNLLDGGIVQQIALESAVKVGATHAIVLMTRKSDESVRPTTGRSHQFECAMLRARYGDILAKKYESRNGQINKLIDEIKAGHVSFGGRDMIVDGIERSAAGTKISRLTKDSGELRKAFFEGRAASFAYIDNGERAQS